MAKPTRRSQAKFCNGCCLHAHFTLTFRISIRKIFSAPSPPSFYPSIPILLCLCQYLPKLRAVGYAAEGVPGSMFSGCANLSRLATVPPFQQPLAKMIYTTNEHELIKDAQHQIYLLGHIGRPRLRGGRGTVDTLYISRLWD